MNKKGRVPMGQALSTGRGVETLPCRQPGAAGVGVTGVRRKGCSELGVIPDGRLSQRLHPPGAEARFPPVEEEEGSGRWEEHSPRPRGSAGSLYLSNPLFTPVGRCAGAPSLWLLRTDFLFNSVLSDTRSVP